MAASGDEKLHGRRVVGVVIGLLGVAMLGSLVLGESISFREIAGALVIGSALLLIDGRLFDLARGVVPFRPAE